MTPPQDFDNEEQVKTWKDGYEKWSKENDHLPNLPPTDQMLQRLKQQKQMMEQRQAQQGQAPGGPTVQHQKNLNTQWYYTVEGNDKIEVHADQQYITSLKPQYYQREQDGTLTKVVDDPQFEARQKTRQIVQQNKQPKGSPAPPASKKPPKRKKPKVKKSPPKRVVKKTDKK